MKVWNMPVLEELDMKATAYAPESGPKVDGAYISKDGKYQYNTYCPSGGNSGTPRLAGNDPSVGQQRTGDGFVIVQ